MKCRVKVGNLYFSRWLGEDALMIVDDSPRAKYAAMLFGNINQALSVSRAIGGTIEHINQEEGTDGGKSNHDRFDQK